MRPTDEEKPKGLLNPQSGERHFQLARYLPAEDIRGTVEHYWIVQWDLCDPYVSENLPYPSVHLVVQAGQSGIFGVVTGKFTRVLEGRDRAFGIKFRPGAFYPLAKGPVSRFTNSSLRLEDVLGADGTAFEAALLALDAPDQQIECAEAFLRPRLPERDETVELVNRVIEMIVAHPTLTRVRDVAASCHLSERTLQRLFSRYVGVSPKWVIQRYRLYEASEQVAAGHVVDWTKLALDLGYFDQAHFIKDFKAIVGYTPADYARQVETY